MKVLILAALAFGSSLAMATVTPVKCTILKWDHTDPGRRPDVAFEQVVRLKSDLEGNQEQEIYRDATYIYRVELILHDEALRTKNSYFNLMMDEIATGERKYNSSVIWPEVRPSHGRMAGLNQAYLEVSTGHLKSIQFLCESKLN